MSLRHRGTGGRILVADQSNLVVNQAADAMALMVDPTKRFTIRYAYFEFGDTDSIFAAADLEDSAESMSSLVAPMDYIRAPIITTPAISVADDDAGTYAGNRSTFFVSTATAPSAGAKYGEASGVEFADGVFVGAACLVASDGTKANDKIFSRVIISGGPIEKPAGYDLDIHWELVFAPN